MDIYLDKILICLFLTRNKSKVQNHCHCHKRWLKIRVENVTKLLDKFIKL